MNKGRYADRCNETLRQIGTTTEPIILGSCGAQLTAFNSPSIHPSDASKLITCAFTICSVLRHTTGIDRLPPAVVAIIENALWNVYDIAKRRGIGLGCGKAKDVRDEFIHPVTWETLPSSDNIREVALQQLIQDLAGIKSTHGISP